MSSVPQRIKALTGSFSRSVSRLKREISPKSVHRLRTTIRRVESVIDYIQPELEKKQRKVLKELASLRRRAGRVRDLDVQAGLLGAIANGSTAADRRALKDLLQRKRERQARRLATAIGKVRTPRLLAWIKRIGVADDTSLDAGAQAAANPLDQARVGLAKLAIKVQGSDLKPKRLHEVRIKLKRIRYLAEVAEDSAAQTRFLEQMESVQDAIGEWHDWETLAKTAEKLFGDRMNCALLVEIQSLFSARYSAAASAVARLLAQFAPPAVKKQPRSAAQEQSAQQSAS
jgi:CHAD domain-containing protein